MIDTSVLISALLWPSSKPAKAVLHAAKYHDLILCNHIIYEMREVIARKASSALDKLEVFLQELPCELVTDQSPVDLMISDPKDQPILNAAILANADIIMSSDKHFLHLSLSSPRTMNSEQYLSEIAGRID